MEQRSCSCCICFTANMTHVVLLILFFFGSMQTMWWPLIMASHKRFYLYFFRGGGGITLFPIRKFKIIVQNSKCFHKDRVKLKRLQNSLEHPPTPSCQWAPLGVQRDARRLPALCFSPSSLTRVVSLFFSLFSSLLALSLPLLCFASFAALLIRPAL